MKNVNKGVLVTVVILFAVFAVSCRTVRPQKIGISHYHSEKSIKVYKVLTKNGELIEFPNHKPARLKNRQITGFVYTDELGISRAGVTIPLEEVEKIWVKKFSLGKTLYNSTIGVYDHITNIETPKRKKK